MPRFLSQRDLDVRATNAMTLNTLVDTVTAHSTSTGNIVINEADLLTAEEVVAQNGQIDISSGGDMTVLDIRAMTEGNDITLKSSEDLYVDYVDAGVLGGSDRTGSVVTLDAGGTIRGTAGPYR